MRDLFIFSCYTGLAYNKLKRFSKKHVVKGFDGMNWIEMTRGKSQREISVPLLKKAQELLDVYSKEDSV